MYTEEPIVRYIDRCATTGKPQALEELAREKRW